MKEIFFMFITAPIVQVIVGAGFVLWIFCIWLDNINRNVAVGVSESMDTSQRHGNAWVEVDGAIVQRRFMVDKPHLLEDPNRFQIKDIFSQLNAMGLNLKSLEILVGDKVRVYHPDQTRPVLVAAR